MILVLALLTGCLNPEPYEGMFDLPAAATVLPATHMAPFSEPVGYVANRFGGRIGILALKQGLFLSDTPTASFVRGAPLATGANRTLTSVAAWSPSDGEIHVFAGDSTYNTLVRVTHVESVDASGYPQRGALTWGDATFTDADGSGDSPKLTDLTFKLGYSATESFRVERRESGWWVTGSRSGVLPGPVELGLPYLGERRNISFTLEGDGTPGDFFEVAVDSGLLEYDVGGAPEHLLMSPDQSRLAVVVSNDEGRAFAWFDPATGEATHVDLGGGEPDRLAFSPDGSALYVADTALPAVHVWSSESDTFSSITLPWPIDDVAPMVREDGSTMLYVHPIHANQVWLLDVDTGELIDVNPFTAGVQGMQFQEPVRGLASVHIPVLLQTRDANNERIMGRSVGVSLQNDRVVFMAEETGCLVRSAFGPSVAPYTDLSGSVDYVDNFRSVVESPPYLASDAWYGEAVSFPACGGLTQKEEWRLTYRSMLGGWEVEGDVSGVQQNVAYEDTRYVSDAGEFSLMVRSGGTPSRDGWRMEFRATPGVVEATGNNLSQSSGRNITLALPADPVYFSYLAGPAGEQTERPYLLVVAEGADLAARVHPGDGNVEATWW